MYAVKREFLYYCYFIVSGEKENTKKNDQCENTRIEITPTFQDIGAIVIFLLEQNIWIDGQSEVDVQHFYDQIIQSA